jgi:hypothetical protein
LLLQVCNMQVGCATPLLLDNAEFSSRQLLSERLQQAGWRSLSRELTHRRTAGVTVWHGLYAHPRMLLVSGVPV